MRVWTALFAAVLAGVVAGFACARGQRAPEPTSRMDPALRRVAAAASDTVVGIFIRTVRPVSADDRRKLEKAGVRIGTVTGDMLSGRVAARRLRDVAALPIVRYMELAATLRPQGSSRPGASSLPVFDGIA